MDIDYRKIFNSLPSLMGLQMDLRYGKWYGGYYLNGQKHERNDKLKCFFDRGKIWIMEEGGETMGLWDWMLRYGGCIDNRQVAERLINGGQATISVYEPPKTITETKYVYDYVMKRSMALKDGYEDNLFKYLAKKFGSQRVTDIFRAYNVGNWDAFGKTATVFWVVDREQRVCRDSWIVYGEDGHRLRESGSIGCKFKVRDGFNGRAYFGEHLLMLNDNVFVVEAPKTALILACKYFPKYVFLANMGSGRKMNDLEPTWKIYADNDEAGRKWEKKYPKHYVDWVSFYRDKGVEVGEGEDIGDIIMKL